MNIETLLLCFNFQLLLEHVSFLCVILVHYKWDHVGLKEKLNKVFHVMFKVITTTFKSYLSMLLYLRFFGFYLCDSIKIMKYKYPLGHLLSFHGLVSFINLLFIIHMLKCGVKLLSTWASSVLFLLLYEIMYSWFKLFFSWFYKITTNF